MLMVAHVVLRVDQSRIEPIVSSRVFSWKPNLRVSVCGLKGSSHVALRVLARQHAIVHPLPHVCLGVM